MKNWKIKTSFVTPEVKLFAIRCHTCFFQFVWEPVLIQRILNCFEAILKIFINLDCRTHLKFYLWVYVFTSVCAPRVVGFFLWAIYFKKVVTPPLKIIINLPPGLMRSFTVKENHIAIATHTQKDILLLLCKDIKFIFCPKISLAKKLKWT